MSALALTGCEDNTPASLTRDTQEWVSRANLAIAGMEDQTFAISLWREAHFIGRSMDEGRKVSIDLFYLIDGELTCIPVTRGYKLTHINDSWQEIVASQIICGIAESEDVIALMKDSQTMEVVGATLTWESYSIFGKKIQSVLDCDNDENWDYISRDNLCSHTYAGSTSESELVLYSYSKWSNICLDEDLDITKISSAAVPLSDLEKLIS